MDRDISAKSLAERASLVREVPDPERSLHQERAEWDEAARSIDLAPGCQAREDRIGDVPCLWLSPEETASEDLVLYAHGGGLVTGSLLTHRAFASELAAALKRNVLLVGYRLLPEHPFTAPRDDFVTVYEALLAVGGYKAEQIIFAGDSSGAAVAMAASVDLGQQNAPQPRAIVSLSGAFDTSLSGDSVEALAGKDPLLSPEVLRDWQKHFRGKTDLKDPVISPLFADLHGIAPVLLLAGDHELWLSDSERMHLALKAAGVSSSLSIYPGMWHVWPMWPDLPETSDAFREIDAFLHQTG
ncbi:alpha/beta hydrolase [Labrenzia sp. VG12]|uniref:alpha/beta hydrolase n=1 Tax=Labrenzia sp. VG12 TaxID=2021862 RepID=UPI000B8BE9A3|nr:alpha/beta hydrolase [Labrenzia sp. VG12]ASP34856.1 hypothetical protein CHH27_17765 [Labrenzia sp. VG12]